MLPAASPHIPRVSDRVAPDRGMSRRRRARLALLAGGLWAATPIACGGQSLAPAPTATPGVTPASATPIPTRAATKTPRPTPTQTPTPTAPANTFSHDFSDPG